MPVNKRQSNLSGSCTVVPRALSLATNSVPARAAGTPFLGSASRKERLSALDSGQVGSLVKSYGWHRSNNSFKPSPLRGLVQVLCKFHLPKAAKRSGLTQALGGTGGFNVTQKLLVKIPISNRFGTIDEEEIERLIVEHQGEFSPLFERSIDVDDARVQLVDDSLEVQQVDIDEDRKAGSAQVEFMSSFYAGCKDQNSDDWHSEDLFFEITADFLIFEIDLPIHWRVDN